MNNEAYISRQYANTENRVSYLFIYLLLEKGQKAKLIRPPKQQVQLQYTLQIISDHIRKSS